MKRLLSLIAVLLIFTGSAVAGPMIWQENAYDPANVAITGGTISGVTVSASSITPTNLTASKPVFTDAAKKLVSTGTLGIDQGGTGVTATNANHIYYVDAGRADSYTADGSALRPYTTILAALTVINADAAAHAAGGDYAGTNYAIVVAPGTYSDNLAFTNYKHMRIVAPAGGVFITGTVTSTQTQQSGDYYSRLEFVGPDGTRTEKGPGLKLAGDITMTRNNDSLTYFTFKGCWITGNILADTDGTFVLHFNGSRVAGTIDTGTFADADSAILIETTGWTEFAGAITDKVSFYNVDNAEFYGAITITPIFDCRITNSRFGSTVSIVAVKNLYVDTVSLKAIVDRTPTLTGMTIGYLDQVANGTYKGIIDTAAPGAIGGTTPAAGSFTTLKATTGAAAGNIPVSDASGNLGYLGAGATTEILVGGGAANPVWTTATGSGAPVRGTSPTIATPVVTIPENIVSASGNVTVAQVSGGIINNYGQANDAVLTLPTAAKGYNFVFIAGTTVAKYLRLDTQATDQIYLDGVAGGDGKYIGVASVAAGNSVSCITFQTGATPDYDWFCSTISGAWVAE